MNEEQEPWMRSPTPEENPEGLGILRAEEDEPNFGPLIERAGRRADEIGGDDGQLIRDLLAAIDHYDNTVHAMTLDSWDREPIDPDDLP